MPAITLNPAARIGILNRGEAALRFVRAVHEHNALHGTRLAAVAFYLEAEEEAPFVRQADLAVPLTAGSAPAGGAASSTDSAVYRDADRLLAALQGSGCQGVWVGWGFLSEDAAFARRLEERGLAFLGPPWQAMERLGDKVAAKELAERAGVPVLPWSRRPVSGLEEAEAAAKAIGYPCMVKAAGAGGGRGIRAVRAPGELAAQYRSAREEALRVTGGDRIFIERLVERARHLEVQVVADRHGTVLTFGVRDCSVQRRNQKIIEETPPPGLDAALTAAMEQSAADLARAAGYQGAGTVEFLYDLDTGRYTFMEVNARLQVEHPVTEQAYGVDLVQMQIQVALGERLPAARPRRHAAAIEVRLNAEDPERGFAPAPGRVLRLRAPAGPGVRVDSGVEEGTRIPPQFDSMIAKIIAFAPDRAQALARLERALAETSILLEGGTTNRAFLRELLRRPEVRRGGVSTRFVEELLQEGAPLVARREWAAAVAAAVVERYLAWRREELANFRQQLAAGGYPREIARSGGLEVGLRVRGRAVRLQVREVAPCRYHLLPGNVGTAPGGGDGEAGAARGEAAPAGTVPVEYRPRERESLLAMGGRRFSVQMVERAGGLQVEIDGVPYPVELESGGLVRAPSPALVLSLPVRPGQRVVRGDVLATLEAMKMEMLVLAPEDGTLKELLVRAGEQVAAGQPLARLEGTEDTASRTMPGSSADGTARGSAQEAEPVRFLDPGAGAPEAPGRVLDQEYLAVFLGFDHDRPGTGLLERMAEQARLDPGYHDALIDLLVRSVEMYGDVERLFSGPPLQAESPARPVPYRELLAHYFRRQGDREKGLPEPFVQALRRALRWYLGEAGDGADPAEALLHVYRSHADLAAKQDLLREALFLLERLSPPGEAPARLSDLLDETAWLAQASNPSLGDAAVHVRARLVDRVLLDRWRAEKREKVGRALELLLRQRRRRRGTRFLVDTLVNTGHHVSFDLAQRYLSGPEAQRPLILEILARRFNRDRLFQSGELLALPGFSIFEARTADAAPAAGVPTPAAPAGTAPPRAAAAAHLGAAAERSEATGTVQGGSERRTLTAAVREGELERLLEELAPALEADPREPPEVVLLVQVEGPADAAEEGLLAAFARRPLRAEWAALGILLPDGQERFYTWRRDAEGRWGEDADRRGFNPRAWRELRVGRLSRFHQERVYGSESVHVLALKARDNPGDERLVALVEVPSGRPQLDEHGRIARMVALENVFMEAVYALRSQQARRRQRLFWNRIVVHIPAVMQTTLEQNREYAARLAARTADLGLEKIAVYSHRPAVEGTEEVELVFENISGASFTLRGRTPSEEPLAPVDAYTARVVRARQRGTVYPYEIIKLVTRAGYPVSEAFPKGDFEEFDLEGDRAVSVRGRPPGRHTGNVVFGLLTSFPPHRPKGLKRVVLLADPTGDMGSLAEAECRRVIAALDLAEERGLPVEWLPVSAGARIEMDSGTENLDWTARALRRIVQFTQDGGEINVLVAGINIGAQSYWNAEATMLMHTRGLLVMTEDAAMLLTGKKALDFSGSVSAEDNVGIGGVERIMGPNGEAQVRARTLYEAYSALLRHYELTWREPGAAWPERQPSTDPADRDAGADPYQDHLGQGFTTIGDVFSPGKNPERKKPFDMRQVMRAVVDRDGPVFERWAGMKDAEVAIVWEARLGGFSAGVIGIESRPLPRIGEVPPDGPESWTGGTLFPLSSKKIARAINAFSGRLPLVILANLSGFDGSPESLRKLQLEYGAEIGRAVVNFRGPILFVVTARYHGGAYVVFSKALNEGLRAAALEGAYASVIGGAPAAAVVFPGLVLKETNADPRIEEARRRLQADRAGYRKEYDALFRQVHAEKQAALARRFDQVHSVERARSVGSIDEIIPLARLRPWLIVGLEEGMHRFPGGAAP